MTAPTTIAELHYGDEHKVRGNGIQAGNDYNTDDMRWHVFVRSGGQISAPPAIPAGDLGLRVDVGPGPDGKPAGPKSGRRSNPLATSRGADGGG